jgi:FtsP/CotA-like multicopper oxidase with cupredoxin domain
VYSGLAAFYFIRDPATEPVGLPSGAQEIELAIQDRQFDTNGQLFFPDGSGDPASNLNGTPPNPKLHPFWIPEFVGDVVVVNGVPWPFLEVEPRRYRFRIVGGANARMWNLNLGAPAWVIGTDDGYLDAPAPIEPRGVSLPDMEQPFVQRLFIAPGERYDVIVDFSSLAGATITVKNDAPVPFPSGLVPGSDQPTMAEVLQFRVTAKLQGTDTSCDPASGGCGRPAAAPVVRLADEGTTEPAQGVTIDRRRQLVLKEVEGPGGPMEVLVNNTKFDGRASPGIASEFRATDGVSELPRVGSTELWEVVNLTADAHPMHTHLVQFQVLSRQAFDFAGYLGAWAAAFPASCRPQPEVGCPGYGPPRPYLVPNDDGAVGGNPALSSFLIPDTARPANPEEAGWKDTAKAHHAKVLRMLVRFAPTSAAVADAQPGRNLFPFDPSDGPGYVWHCHIVDHEDNEMMRPYRVAR